METESPAVTQDAPAASSSPAGGVTPADRPVQNIVGEFNRKIGSLSQKVDQLVTYIAQKEAAAAQPPPSQSGDKTNLSDDDLWELAKQGDKTAFDLHQKRQAERVYNEKRGQENKAAMIEGQMRAIAAKYPVLANPQHPLAQTAQMAYTLLLKRGYPQGAETLLEATKTAIADRPDIIADLHSQVPRAREQARQSAVRHTGTGASYRQDEPRPQIPVSEKEWELARRMGVTDAAKAKERFRQRQAEGKSSFGAVASSITEEF